MSTNKNWQIAAKAVHELRCQGEFSRAADMLKVALKEAEDTGCLDARLMQTLHELAAWYCVQRRYKEAARLYSLGLAAREKILGSQHPDVADSLAKLAVILRETGSTREAMANAFMASSVAAQSARGWAYAGA